MSRTLTILFVPIEAVGHVNACISLGQALLRAGHRVVFAVSNFWEKALKSYGFEVALLVFEDRAHMGDNPLKFIAEKFVETKRISDRSPLEKIMKGDELGLMVGSAMNVDAKIEPVIAQVKPDVIALDMFLAIPVVENSGIPWVWVWSPNPLTMYGDDYDLPPPRLGLPTTGDKSEWGEMRDMVNQAFFDSWHKYNDYVVSKGAKPLKKNQFNNGSPFLNVYSFPEELDYSDIKPLPKHYIRFDHMMRSETLKEFEIPDQLKNKSGKLIYFSLGSMGSADVELMKRLIGILGESKHRFIVSKGPLHEKYELADNMWGQSSVPQLPILPLCDLVITHGGNNTVAETFYYGKPMIVMPLFGDQPDNAQRVHDKGFGIRLDPYRCSKQELLDAIEKLLNDKELNEKLKNISKRIQTVKCIENFPNLIENLVKN